MKSDHHDNDHNSKDTFDNNILYAISEQQTPQEQIMPLADEEEELQLNELLEENQPPPPWIVLKELLGINGFSVLLALLIVIFGSMNIILGPGWLGNVFNIQGTGSFTETSNSLPEIIDLSAPEFRF